MTYEKLYNKILEIEDNESDIYLLVSLSNLILYFPNVDVLTVLKSIKPL